jgi:hypothetical protein
MKLGTEILLRVIIVTVIYAPIFAFSLLASALIVQSHIHPDSWVITKSDIAIGVVVTLMYLATLVLQVKAATKKHSSRKV